MWQGVAGHERFTDPHYDSLLIHDWPTQRIRRDPSRRNDILRFANVPVGSSSLSQVLKVEVLLGRAAPGIALQAFDTCLCEVIRDGAVGHVGYRSIMQGVIHGIDNGLASQRSASGVVEVPGWAVGSEPHILDGKSLCDAYTTAPPVRLWI